MGAYYGLFNSSKKHQVSSYWKGGPPSSDEVIEIAKALQWDLVNDKIISGAYDGSYLWKNNCMAWIWDESDDESEIELDGQKFGWDGEKLTTFDNTFYFN
jgi:hypothetical protein